MEKKPELLENITTAIFTPLAFMDKYPYIIRNKETGEIRIGTYIFVDDGRDKTELRFKFFKDNLDEGTTMCRIKISNVDKFEFMKATADNMKEVIYNMNDTKEESTPDEISEEEKLDQDDCHNKMRRKYDPQNIASVINEHNGESKSDKNIDTGIDPDKMSRLVNNLSKLGCCLIDNVAKDDPDRSNVNLLAKRLGTVLTRTIDYNENKTRLSEDSDIADIDQIFSIESDDYIGIKKFYYKRTYVKNETEDTDTISILIPHPLFMNLPYEMIKSLGYKIHPMFIDINNVIHDKILIGRNILKRDDSNPSDPIEPCNSITMEMYSGLQMLYFIERGLNRTSPEFHGITDLYGDTWTYISCLSIVCKNANLSIELGNGTTIDISDPFDGYIRRFKQIEGFNDYLFIPEGCTWTKGELCDSYNEVSTSYIATDRRERMLVGGSNDFADGALWNYDYRGHNNSISGANFGVRQYRYSN